MKEGLLEHGQIGTGIGARLWRSRGDTILGYAGEGCTGAIRNADAL